MMSTSGYTRGSIPSDLLAIKQAATLRYLKPSTTLGFASAYAVSVRPDDNVVGVGIGRKIADGTPTDATVIRFYVQRKVAPSAVPSDFLLPPAMDGHETDVIETGAFQAFQVAVPPTQERARPCRPGCSIGFQFSDDQAGNLMAGTLGALVSADGKVYVLSNNHVLANENALPAGSPIFQPGLLDGGNAAGDTVAKLARFVALKSDGPNDVDCALAEVVDPTLIQSAIMPEVGALTGAEPVDAVEGMPVHKTGRTSAYTRGSIFDVSADVKVQYGMGILTFQNQILIRGEQSSFSEPGDSGALVVDRGTGRAVGLLMGGTKFYTIANHLSDVLTELKVRLTIG